MPATPKNARRRPLKKPAARTPAPMNALARAAKSEVFADAGFSASELKAAIKLASKTPDTPANRAAGAIALARLTLDAGEYNALDCCGDDEEDDCEEDGDE